MAKWLTDVAISDVDGGELGDYHLLADLMFEDDKGITWTTPAGFIGDLSSFPWFILGVCPHPPRITRARMIVIAFFILFAYRSSLFVPEKLVFNSVSCYFII